MIRVEPSLPRNQCQSRRGLGRSQYDTLGGRGFRRDPVALGAGGTGGAGGATRLGGAGRTIRSAELKGSRSIGSVPMFRNAIWAHLWQIASP